MNNKSTYNPKIHHRRSIRLKGYDYSQQGLYFVTICVKNRSSLFGEIVNQQIKSNDAGVMVDKWYNELENKYPDIICHEHIVMPNHFHCIVENTGIPVGANLRVCPVDGVSMGNIPSMGDTPSMGEASLMGDAPSTGDEISIGDEISPEFENAGHIGPPQRVPNNNNDQHILDEPIFSEYAGSPLWRVIQWFKTMSTNEYIRNVKNNNWPCFDDKLWQRNYWEHIIRNEKSYHTISEYIINNSKNWDNDSINPKNGKTK